MFQSIAEFFTAGWLNFIIAAAVAYLLGSFNFSIIITRIVKNGEDIRKMGSGNAGFTNVLRSVGKGPAVATIILDFAKGVASALIGGWLFSLIPVTGVPAAEVACYGEYICGFICIIGHMLPLYFNFKGGKGVVCAAALAAVADIRVFAIVIPIFIIVVLITKIVSISSLVAAVAFPIVTFCFAYFADYIPSLNTNAPHSLMYVIVSTAFALAVCIFIFVKHKENIKRLKNGTEKKLTIKNKDS